MSRMRRDGLAAQAADQRNRTPHLGLALVSTALAICERSLRFSGSLGIQGANGIQSNAPGTSHKALRTDIGTTSPPSPHHAKRTTPHAPLPNATYATRHKETHGTDPRSAAFWFSSVRSHHELKSLVATGLLGKTPMFALHVEIDPVCDLVVNLKTATALGLAIPESFRFAPSR